MRSSAQPTERGKKMKSATLELSSLKWGLIILALNEAQTMPKKSKELAEMLSELVAVQTGEAK
jgi:hypothetical protein